MSKFIAGLVIGIVIGAVGVWWTQQRHPEAVPESTAEVKQILNAKLEMLELQADKIEKELTDTGKIVRRKATALGEKVATAADDARITTEVKAKILADPDLSALGISVSTTDGIVTLSGKVDSPDLVGKATLLALETEGVHEVIATIQIAKN